MKKFFIFLMTLPLVAATMTSCSNDEDSVVSEQKQEKVAFTIKAQFDQELQTRGVTQADADALKFAWSDDEDYGDWVTMSVYVYAWDEENSEWTTTGEGAGYLPDYYYFYVSSVESDGSATLTLSGKYDSSYTTWTDAEDFDADEIAVFTAFEGYYFSATVSGATYDYNYQDDNDDASHLPYILSASSYDLSGGLTFKTNYAVIRVVYKPNSADDARIELTLYKEDSKKGSQKLNIDGVEEDVEYVAYVPIKATSDIVIDKITLTPYTYDDSTSKYTKASVSLTKTLSKETTISKAKYYTLDLTKLSYE